MSSSDGNNSINITDMEDDGVDVESLDVVLEVEKIVGKRLGFHERYDSQLSITSSRTQDRPEHSSVIISLIWCILLLAIVWYRRRRQENFILPLTVTRSDNTKKLIGAPSKEYKHVDVGNTCLQNPSDENMDDTAVEKIMVKSRCANGLERFNGSLGAL